MKSTTIFPVNSLNISWFAEQIKLFFLSLSFCYDFRKSSDSILAISDRMFQASWGFKRLPYIHYHYHFFVFKYAQVGIRGEQSIQRECKQASKQANKLASKIICLPSNIRLVVIKNAVCLFVYSVIAYAVATLSSGRLLNSRQHLSLLCWISLTLFLFVYLSISHSHALTPRHSRSHYAQFTSTHTHTDTDIYIYINFTMISN